uniref:Uncharacterized protein n=1 Tax=Anguilla anguilla TaxID=7936 RepID=A0A0E9V360_ANGAN
MSYNEDLHGDVTRASVAVAVNYVTDYLCQSF